jgi:hypothetical protein
MQPALPAAAFTPVQQAVILGTPLVLGVLEVWHPVLVRGDICGTLAPVVTWWTVLHLLQIPLFALLGGAVILLLQALLGRTARIGRWAAVVFLVAYPAFDAVVGVGSGVLLQSAGDIDAEQRRVLETSLQGLFRGPATQSLAVIGSTAWLVALAATALAWLGQGAPWPVAAAFVASGVLLSISHIPPFGPLACLFFLVGATWLVLLGRGHLRFVHP